MEMISIKDLRKNYGPQPALSGISLKIDAGELLVLIGPSGCGKSTLLKCINRMVEADEGEIFVNGRSVKEYKEETLRRGIGYCIQEVGLFPHMSIFANIATVPRLLKWTEEKIKARVDELIGISGLPADYLTKYPGQLSGGEAQRVGVLRALAADPPILLMDEPFGAVDPLTRENLQKQFLMIQKELKKTVVFVTHDVDEAILLADRIAIMNKGALVALDEPLKLEGFPRDGFAGSFLGQEFSLKLLGRYTVDDLELAYIDSSCLDPSMEIIQVGPETTLKDLMSEMIKAKEDFIQVRQSNGKYCRLALCDIKWLMHEARQ
jgi:osmoprotectant transport system ATP-binding protein